MIPKRTKNTDISSEVARGKVFKEKLLRVVTEAVTDFMDNGVELSEAIARISIREQFNQLQIQRFVEEANTIAFNKRYDQVRGQKDRRISFNIAGLKDVLEAMGEQAPPEIENPNWIKGKSGDGEITKVASSVSVFNQQLQTLNDSRQAFVEQKALEKQATSLNREIESNLFKVANALVMSEKFYQNGNKLFNTLLEKVAFDDVFVDGISKKAEEIVNVLKGTNRIAPSFAIDLQVAPQEKIASTLFGSYSLQKQASEYVETPKIYPTANVQDFQELLEVAKKIQASQQNVVDVEKKLHGGNQ